MSTSQVRPVSRRRSSGMLLITTLASISGALAVRGLWHVLTGSRATDTGQQRSVAPSAGADRDEQVEAPRTAAAPGASHLNGTRRADQGMAAYRQVLDRVNREWSGWPGQIVRAPRLTEPHYLQHRRLLLTFIRAIERNLPEASNLTVVDLGAGKKPYFPFWSSRAGRYLGVDLPGTPGSQVYAVSERLPFRDESADVVVSTQMLEHADDPPAVLAECYRALRPGGLMFASTHGASYYHPIPVDHWRWTHTGLRRLFERSGFRVRSVEATTGTLTTLTTLLASYYLGLAHRFGCERLAAQALVPLNLLVRQLDGIDSRPPTDERDLHWGSMPWTYLVVAERVA